MKAVTLPKGATKRRTLTTNAGNIEEAYVMKVCKLKVCFTAHTCFESL